MAEHDIRLIKQQALIDGLRSTICEQLREAAQQIKWASEHTTSMSAEYTGAYLDKASTAITVAKLLLGEMDYEVAKK